MNHKPKISVIMAAYNAEKYIEKSIESILNQTFKDFELIITNDASTDKTLEIIKKYAKKDHRIIVLKNKKNIYATKSRNRALKIARGGYIAIQDADDISLSQRLRVQYNFLEKNKDIFLIGTNVKWINSMGKSIKKRKQMGFGWFRIKILPFRNFMYHPTIMFRNERIFYREKIYYCEDYDFYLLLLTMGKKIAHIGIPLVLYRILKDSVSRKKKVAAKKIFQNLKEILFPKINF